MLKIGVIQEVNHVNVEIISNIFKREKKEKGQYRPIINPKPLNVFTPHETFKMETLKNVKDLLQKGDLLMKIDLKNAYYTVNLAKESRKLVRFQWDGNPYENMSLVFGLGPAPRIFTKILRVPVTILRKMKVRLVIYIDGMLIFAKSQQEVEMARDIVVCDKLGEVRTNPTQDNGIPGSNNKLRGNDFLNSRSEDAKNSMSL